MTLGEIYRFVLAEGMKVDPRGEEGLRKVLERRRDAYGRLEEEERARYDTERLTNPYGDLRIVHGREWTEVRGLLVGLDPLDRHHCAGPPRDLDPQDPLPAALLPPEFVERCPLAEATLGDEEQVISPLLSLPLRPEEHDPFPAFTLQDDAQHQHLGGEARDPLRRADAPQLVAQGHGADEGRGRAGL